MSLHLLQGATKAGQPSKADRLFCFLWINRLIRPDRQEKKRRRPWRCVTAGVVFKPMTFNWPRPAVPSLTAGTAAMACGKI